MYDEHYFFVPNAEPLHAQRPQRLTRNKTARSIFISKANRRMRRTLQIGCRRRLVGLS